MDMRKCFWTISACMVVLMTACNTAQRLNRAERFSKNSIRLPFRSEVRDTTTIKVPQYVTFKDANGKDNMVMTAELDSATGKYELTGGELAEVTVTAAAKSVTERNGKVNIDFVVTVPSSLMMKDWRMVILPSLDNSGERRKLDSLEITGTVNHHFNLRRQRQLNRELSSVSRSKTALERRAAWGGLRRGIKPEPVIADLGTQVGFDSEINAAADLTGKGMRLDTVMERGDDYIYFYTQQLESQGLSSRLRLWFDSYIVNCGDEVYNLAASDTVFFNISSFLQFMDHAPRYVR